MSHNACCSWPALGASRQSLACRCCFCRDLASRTDPHRFEPGSAAFLLAACQGLLTRAIQLWGICRPLRIRSISRSYVSVRDRTRSWCMAMLRFMPFLPRASGSSVRGMTFSGQETSSENWSGSDSAQKGDVTGSFTVSSANHTYIRRFRLADPSSKPHCIPRLCTATRQGTVFFFFFFAFPHFPSPVR